MTYEEAADVFADTLGKMRSRGAGGTRQAKAMALAEALLRAHDELVWRDDAMDRLKDAFGSGPLLYASYEAQDIVEREMLAMPAAEIKTEEH